MMNALSMAVYLDKEPDMAKALEAWERAERPLTEHTQRMSLMLGWPATWPPFLRAKALAFAGKSKWMVRQADQDSTAPADRNLTTIRTAG